jgi:signal transduction histidine kinase
LANLLDSSLRNLNLVISGMREHPGRTSPPTPSSTATGTASGSPIGSAPDQEDDDLVRRLDATNQGMRQMAQLIHRWLGRSGPDQLHQQTHTLGHVIEHAVRLLQPAAAARQIAVTTCVSDQAAQLAAGPVYPVIANALRNSIEALSTGPRPPGAGHVEIIAQVQHDVVDISVRDDGPGISAALLDEQGRFCFGSTTKPEGHGLGLSLSRDIAAALGGELRLENRQPRGTVLTLRYPLGSA